MKKVLFINYCLQMAGAEKYVNELCNFAIKNGLKPYVLIPNNLKKEYYDDALIKLGVKVIRVNLIGIKNAIRSRDLHCMYWNILLRFGLKFKFKSINFINLVIAERYEKVFRFPKKNFWHITNRIQYSDNQYHFRPELFSSKCNTIIYCNKYQKAEIKAKYGDIQCKEIAFKLFTYKDET